MTFILTVDQSTSGSKAALMDQHGQLLRVSRRSHAQYHPAPGHVEHDAEEIWQNVSALMLEVTSGLDRREIAGITISNQRETTVLWERATGRPVHPAIVWQDVRAAALVESLAALSGFVREKTGLMLSPYYPAAKVAAVFQEHPELASRAWAGELCMGTVDSYLLYRLTGGERFCTDVSNASRTQLMDLRALRWDAALAGVFDLPMELLANEILPSDGAFGSVRTIAPLEGVPVLAMMGDSHAALFGHGCCQPGQVKATYGTGSSIMMNVGAAPMGSTCGLSASVGYGTKDGVCYVLEGNVTCSADTLMWLRDDLKLIQSMDELSLASTVPSSEGVYLVPAFSGLGAPWFDSRARALLCGMTRGTTRAHVLYAALESIVQQNADVLEAMAQDAACPVRAVAADGGPTVNPLLMQLQSDLVPCAVRIPAQREMSLMGAGLMGAEHLGWPVDAMRPQDGARYDPVMTAEERAMRRSGWQDALRRCR